MDNSLLICGLPESGKTTFLGALSYLISNQEVSTSIRENGLPEQRKYITELSDRWASCEKMERNRSSDFHDICFPLEDNRGAFELLSPDLAGETWLNDVCCDRKCSEKVIDYASRSGGILFFIHAKNILDVIPINACPLLGTEEKGSQPDSPIPWNPLDHYPTQASVVDLLQLLSDKPMGLEQRRVVIMLSAWDMVSNKGLSPSQYLEQYLPLLYQYLESRHDYKQYRVYGISAQGGDFENERDHLLDIDNPSERIIVQSDEDQSHDLTLPIQWALCRD